MKSITITPYHPLLKGLAKRAAQTFKNRLNMINLNLDSKYKGRK